MNSKKEKLLADLDVLVLDCQATSSAPGRGDLLEIGWVRTTATTYKEDIKNITTYLIKLPEGIEMSRAVKRITGISEEDLTDALSPKKVWKKLCRTAREIAGDKKNESCPTVIHFSRFEEPYLRQMQQKWASAHHFPFEIICTHQILKVLLPHLPRKGLRAVAGYFGHSVPELRRSASHVEATAFTWRNAVQLLEESQGIRTLTELQDWLEKTRQQAAVNSRSGARVYPMKKQYRKGLPDKPGIYRMLRSNGDLLYIGKATSLKQRVNSYFHKSTRHGERTLEMLTQANRLDFTVTGSALEAALLESDEIKKHSPPYNVALRPGDREIAFFSKDLHEFSPTADDNHPLGPLPSKESLAAFSSVARLLTGQSTNLTDTDSPPLILGIHPDYSPGLECFRQGVEIFKQKHSRFLGEPGWNNFFNGLMLLGKQLRLQKLEELARAESEDEGDDTPAGTVEAEDEVEEERVWTPESAAGVIEGIIRHGAHLIRRSRWFCLLSESWLTWVETLEKEERRIWIQFEGGTIGKRGDLAVGKEVELPVSPGHRKGFLQRRQGFNLSTYDRMRVVTTELRRIITESNPGDVQLRPGPSAVLGKEELSKLLQWV